VGVMTVYSCLASCNFVRGAACAMRALVYGYRQLLMDRWAAVLVDGTAGTLLSFLEAEKGNSKLSQP
jgi:hypothetical protein